MQNDTKGGNIMKNEMCNKEFKTAHKKLEEEHMAYERELRYQVAREKSTYKAFLKAKKA